MSAHELVIIGAGPGGYVAALRAAQLGLKVTLIEREKVGGTCLHKGCIPSKTLIHGAEVFDTVQKAADWGVRLPGAAKFDYAVLAGRKDKTVATLEKGVEFLLSKRGVTVLRGEASFAGTHAINLSQSGGSGEPLEFEHCIIATGSVPKLLPNFPMDGQTYVTSDEVLRWTAMPASMVIVGAGVIGCEFASLFARLGAQVQIVELLDGCLPNFDDDVRKEVERGLKKQNIELRFGVKVEEAGHGPAGGVLTLSDGETVSAQAIIVAVGRTPATEGLGLENAGLELGKGGTIPVNAQCRTSVEHIYAIGDVTGVAPFAHAASHMGIVAVERIAGAKRGGRELSFDPLHVPWAVFTKPEVGTLGLTEVAAKANGREVKVGKFATRGLGRAQATGEIDGFAKVVADAKTGKLLGLHIVGAHATDILGEATGLFASEASLEQLADTIHAHPTFPEAIMEAALAALGKPLHGV